MGSEWRAQQIRLGLKGKDALSSKTGEKGSWRHRNTKVKGPKPTQTTLSNTKKQQHLQNVRPGRGWEGQSVY